MKRLVILLFVLLLGFQPAYSMGRKTPPPKGIITAGEWTRDFATRKVKKLKLRQEGEEGRLDDVQFSPDGRSLSYLFNVRTPGTANIERTELRVAEADGNNQKVVLTGDLDIFNYGWSPDSRYLLASGGESRDGFLIIDPQNGLFWESPIDDRHTGDVRWAKNGKSVLLLAIESKEKAWFRMNLDGSDRQELLRASKFAIAEVSPNEKTALLTTPGKRELFLVDLATKSSRRIWNWPRNWENFYWSPDGEWVGYSQHGLWPDNPARSYYIKSVSTGETLVIPGLREVGPQMHWWAPPTGTPPDCEKILLDALGPGKKLEGVHPLP